MGFWILRGRGVPVSTVGPDTIHGYDIKKFQKSLIKLGYKINTAQHNSQFSADVTKREAPVN
jgi:hypothetical protein